MLPIRTALSLQRTLTGSAVDPENTAGHIRRLAMGLEDSTSTNTKYTLSKADDGI